VVPDIRKNTVLHEDYQASADCPSDKGLKWRWTWGISWMIPAREIRCARRETCPTVTSPTTYLTKTGQGMNPGLRGMAPRLKPEVYRKNN
jgi:hypothetical protein